MQGGTDPSARCRKSAPPWLRRIARTSLAATTSHSIPDNLMAFLGYGRTWNRSAENARFTRQLFGEAAGFGHLADHWLTASISENDPKPDEKGLMLP
jgi:hypothetical protein